MFNCLNPKRVGKIWVLTAYLNGSRINEEYVTVQDHDKVLERFLSEPHDRITRMYLGEGQLSPKEYNE